MAHRVTTRPLFGDVDAMGVVYYANYLRFFELGRCELMRAGGGSYSELAQGGLHLPVTETGLRYRRPALYDQLITIETTVAWAKRASLRFNYLITADNGHGGPDRLVDGFTVHGCVEATGKVVALPDWVREVALAHREEV